MSEEPKRPWATLEADGVHVHLPMPNGSVLTWPCTVDGAYELIVVVADKLAELKTDTALQKRLGSGLVGMAIDWFQGRKSK